MSQKLSTIEQRLKDRALSKLSNETYAEFTTHRRNFDYVNTWISKKEIEQCFNDKGDTRISTLLDRIRNKIIEHYSNKYIENEIQAFLNKVDSIEAELNQLRSEVENN